MCAATLRLENELKARFAAAVERSNKTAQSDTASAMAQTAEQVMRDVAFHRIADERWEQTLASSKSVPWADVQTYLDARVRGEWPALDSSALPLTLKEAPIARIEVVPGVLEDFDRELDHLIRFEGADLIGRVDEIVQALQILMSTPLVGRRVSRDKREFVSVQASRGYVVLYRYVRELDVVFVLALRRCAGSS